MRRLSTSRERQRSAYDPLVRIATVRAPGRASGGLALMSSADGEEHRLERHTAISAIRSHTVVTGTHHRRLSSSPSRRPLPPRARLAGRNCDGRRRAARRRGRFSAFGLAPQHKLINSVLCTRSERCARHCARSERGHEREHRIRHDLRTARVGAQAHRHHRGRADRGVDASRQAVAACQIHVEGSTFARGCVCASASRAKPSSIGSGVAAGPRGPRASLSRREPPVVVNTQCIVSPQTHSRGSVWKIELTMKTSR